MQKTTTRTLFIVGAIAAALTLGTVSAIVAAQSVARTIEQPVTLSGFAEAAAQAQRTSDELARIADTASVELFVGKSIGSLEQRVAEAEEAVK